MIADQFGGEGSDQVVSQWAHFGKWFTKIVNQPADSFLHNSVLQSVAEAVEQHTSLVDDTAKLLMSVYNNETLGLA